MLLLEVDVSVGVIEKLDALVPDKVARLRASTVNGLVDVLPVLVDVLTAGVIARFVVVVLNGVAGLTDVTVNGVVELSDELWPDVLISMLLGMSPVPEPRQPARVRQPSASRDRLRMGGAFFGALCMMVSCETWVLPICYRHP